jgi:5-methylcytosine-specific restriction endonuclease McrA
MDKKWQERKWRRAGLYVLGFKSYEYDKYLETEHWKTFRSAAFAEQLARLGHNCCEHCSKNEKAKSGTKLVVHHLTYERLGKEHPEDAVIICGDCHDKIHGRDAKSQMRHRAPDYRA